MQNKEDIGILLEKKLHGIQKTPSTALWGRVDASLTKKDKKRKRILWFWRGIGIFLLIITLRYGVTSGVLSSDNLEKLKNGTTIEESKEKTSKKMQTENEALEIVSKPSDENPKKETIISEVISEELNLENKNKTIAEKDIANQSSIEKNLKPQESNSFNKTRKTTASMKNNDNNKNNDEDYTINTTYYYYNGANNEHITTTDKKTIDSILKVAENLKDTLDADQKLSLKIIQTNDSLNK